MFTRTSRCSRTEKVQKRNFMLGIRCLYAAIFFLQHFDSILFYLIWPQHTILIVVPIIPTKVLILHFVVFSCFSQSFQAACCYSLLKVMLRLNNLCNTATVTFVSFDFLSILLNCGGQQLFVSFLLEPCWFSPRWWRKMDFSFVYNSYLLYSY